MAGNGLNVKGQGHWERKGENRFLLMSSSKVARFILGSHQTKTTIYTCRRIHFTSGNASFMWYLSVIIRMSQRPSGRALTCLPHNNQIWRDKKGKVRGAYGKCTYGTSPAVGNSRNYKWSRDSVPGVFPFRLKIPGVTWHLTICV